MTAIHCEAAPGYAFGRRCMAGWMTSMEYYGAANRANWDERVPWEALPGPMARTEAGECRLARDPWRLPHSHTLQAVKGR
jgi:hypothetical protein